MLDKVRNIFKKSKETDAEVSTDGNEPLKIEEKMYPTTNVFPATCGSYKERKDGVEFCYSRVDLFLVKSVFTKDKRRVFVKKISGNIESSILETKETPNTLRYDVDLEENGIKNTFTIHFESDLKDIEEFWDRVGILRTKDFVTKSSINYYVEEKNKTKRETSFNNAVRVKKTEDILNEEFQGVEIGEDE